ncbi:hypothetical protein MLD38_026487 [Melastoma candidum]|uniref:Uncharacterized protein n=1 Tax=Melastoma candidum TaxID=119954 RepID=A0ACB9P1K8_9MYRT|nr:hypothetical protein MLD38_026487 [Melastoma candidum]
MTSIDDFLHSAQDNAFWSLCLRHNLFVNDHWLMLWMLYHGIYGLCVTSPSSGASNGWIYGKGSILIRSTWKSHVVLILRFLCWVFTALHVLINIYHFYNIYFVGSGITRGMCGTLYVKVKYV